MWYHCAKVKGDNFDCTCYRDVSLPSVVGKAYNTVQVERIREGTGGMICYEQGRFKRGRGCIDQIFVVRQVPMREMFIES